MEELSQFDFFPPATIESFKEHLDPREMFAFENEEAAIEKSLRRLLEKYNEIVATRISHAALIEELQTALDCKSARLKHVLSSFENKTLQTILSVIVLAKKDKKEE